MSDALSSANVLPAPLSPVDTGDADADAAITELQRFPMSPHTPFPRPGGDAYEALLARAEAVGAERLVPLLDDAATATGQSRWDEEQLRAMTTGERRKFKKHYDQVLAAVAIRKAYLHWLIGAVCNTPAGLERAIEIVRGGTTDARLVAANALTSHLRDDAAKRRVAEALDLCTWDGEDRALERVYRAGVILSCQLDPTQTFERYAPLLRGATPEPGDERSDAVLAALFYGLIAAANPDPRWTELVLPHLAHPLRLNLVAMLLQHLPPEPAWVEPLCAALPEPGSSAGFWNRTLVEALGRAADARAIPWLVAALHASWMCWPAAFEGFRRVGDPAMAHVIREWLATHGAPDRNEAGARVIAELEQHGTAPAPKLDFLAPPPPPTRQRPVLKYVKAPPFAKPKLDSLAKLTKVYARAFADAGLEGKLEHIAKRAVWMIPKRINETRLELGATKLGGHADLPADTKWPRVRREPLTFLAQIDLADVATALPEGLLPPAGLLSFFLSNDPDGKAGYCEKAKVVFTPPGATLVRREVPSDFYDLIYQAAKVRLHPTLRLPSPTNRQLTKRLKGAKLDAYEAEVYDSTCPVFPQLLGYRDHGYDAEEPATSELLLQLPGDDQTEMEFGDVDVLGIYIHRKKLAAGDFAKVWPHVGD